MSSAAGCTRSGTPGGTLATEAVKALATATVQPSLDLGQDQFYGLHAAQGSRTLITVNLPLIDVPDYVVRPNPAVPTQGNRRVSYEHAVGFKNYMLRNEKWVSPPLILRADQMVEWEALGNGQARIKLVKAHLNRKLRRLGILDGQHRVLGICLACDEVGAIAVIGLKQLLHEAIADGDVVAQAKLQRQVDEAERWTERLSTEVIPVTIVIEANEADYRQAFFDIADNQLGMQQTLKVMFDTRKMLNRAVGKVIVLPLLKGRVDLEVDRVLGPNPNWLAAKSILDILRHLHTDSITGSITSKRERELTEQAVVENMSQFLDVLCGAFPKLAAMRDGKLTAPELRKDSLLSSPVFIRVLTSGYHELLSKHAWTPTQVQAFFHLLAPHLGTPLKPDSIWVKGAPGAFSVGSSAPEPRNQQLRTEVDLVVRWAITPDARPSALAAEAIAA